MKPNCTEILRLAPCDPYGAQRESFVSLIVRTAAENDTSPAILLERKFHSHEGLRGLALSSRAMGGWIGQALNGSSDITLQLVKCAEKLTLQENLRASTTLNFAPFSTINGLIRRKFAWSPGFLEGSKVQYYPLAWSLDAVRVCNKTGRPLLTLCPHCRESLNQLAGGSRMGICNKCGETLCTKGGNNTDPNVVLIRDLEYERWIADQIGSFIQFQVNGRLPENFSYTTTLRFWLDKFSLDSAKDAAVKLGASKPAMHNWLNNASIPKLRMTLNICWVLGLSLQEFLLCRVPERHDGLLRASRDMGARYSKAFTRRKIDRPKVEAVLVDLLRTNRYALMPFTEICQKKLKRRAVVIRQTFPELSRQLGRRYLSNRRIMAETRKHQVCSTIKELARILHNHGIVPNHKTLSPYLDRASQLRCEWAIVALNEIRAELGYDEKSEQLLLAV